MQKMPMEKPDNYSEAQKTAQRYQDNDYASSYKREYVGGWKLKHLRSRLIARMERAAIIDAFDTVALKGKILDIPCGTGKLGQVLSQYPVKIIAADISAAMMRLAREEYDAEKLIDLIVCDAADIPLERNQLDSIVCLRLMQRLPADYRARILAEFHRVAQKHLIVSYSISTPWQLMKHRLRWTYDRSGLVLFPVSREAMQEELRDAGYEIVGIKNVLPVISSQVIVIARNNGT